MVGLSYLFSVLFFSLKTVAGKRANESIINGPENLNVDAKMLYKSK